SVLWHNTLRAFEQDPLQDEPDEHDAQIAATGIEWGWELIRQDVAERPQPPDDGGADDGAAVVATAAGHQHDPDEKRPHKGIKSVRANEFDIVRIKTPAQPHEHGSQDQRLHLKAKHIFPDTGSHGLVLPNGFEHPAPGRAYESLTRQVHHGDRQQEQDEIKHVVERAEGLWERTWNIAETLHTVGQPRFIFQEQA